MSEKKIIDKEVLYNLYIVENKSIHEICSILKTGTRVVIRNLKNYNILKSKEQITKNIKKTKLLKYGNENYNNIKQIKETNIAKYGTTTPLQNVKIKKEIEKIKIEKYKNKNYVNSEKAKETKLHKYGNENYNNPELIKLKYKSKTKQEKNKILEKRKSTNIIKYGTNSHFQSNIKHQDIWFNKEKLIEFINNSKIKTTKYLEEYFNITNSNVLLDSHKNNYYHLLNHSDSRYEIELQQLLTSWNIKYEINNRNIIKPYELDIYIPSLNIAIEFNGDYWHSEKYKPNNYHIDKSNLCKEQEIQLIHIWEYEWERNKEKIINYLKDILNINQKIIYGRNCIIQEIDARTKNIFLNENHLQGEDKASLKYGLFHNNELIGVMTWGKPRFNKKFDWELSRLCFKSGYKVIGGAEKLFKYKPEGNLISYCNISKFKGSVYKKLDFTLSHISPPNYVWTNGSEILSRYKCQMKNENKIMTDKGFYKIYDCGNQVWIFTK